MLYKLSNYFPITLEFREVGGGKKEKQDASKLSLKEEQTRLAEFTARFQMGFRDTDSSSWTRGAVVPTHPHLLTHGFYFGLTRAKAEHSCGA